MKYWNKSKKYRELHWTTVSIDYSLYWEDIKRWCQLHPSRYKFYSSPWGRRSWYFENAEDALVFKLVWMNKNE